jgi:hypothetical protein
MPHREPFGLEVNQSHVAKLPKRRETAQKNNDFGSKDEANAASESCQRSNAAYRLNGLASGGKRPRRNQVYIIKSKERQLRCPRAEPVRQPYEVADHVGGALLPSGSFWHARLVPYSGGRRSTAGGTGDAPVCCARWWDGRREMATPVTMVLPKTIKPMATTPAISTISIWIAMDIPTLATLLSGKDMGTERRWRHPGHPGRYISN